MNKLKVQRKKFSEVKPHPDNPRTITDEALNGLASSIETFGYVEPIIFNEQTGFVVGGHQRMKALKRQGETAAEMVIVNMEPVAERALMVALNNQHIQGVWTADLQAVLEQVHESLPEQYEEMQFDALERSAAALFASIAQETEKPPPHTVVVGEDKFMVLVTCEDERQCKNVYEEMIGRGFECKVIT